MISNISNLSFNWKLNDGIMKPDSQFLNKIELEKNLLMDYVKTI